MGRDRHVRAAGRESAQQTAELCAHERRAVALRAERVCAELHPPLARALGRALLAAAPALEARRTAAGERPVAVCGRAQLSGRVAGGRQRRAAVCARLAGRGGRSRSRRRARQRREGSHRMERRGAHHRLGPRGETPRGSQGEGRGAAKRARPARTSTRAARASGANPPRPPAPAPRHCHHTSAPRTGSSTRAA